tara:strand:+ start:153 stop:722 length:570 start_codon:yes stop_codon:yes gene_type:complete
MNIQLHNILFSQINFVSAIKNICPFNLIKGLIKILPKENPTNNLINTDLFKTIKWNNINSVDTYLFNSCQLLTSKIIQELKNTNVNMFKYKNMDWNYINKYLQFILEEYKSLNWQNFIKVDYYTIFLKKENALTWIKNFNDKIDIPQTNTKELIKKIYSKIESMAENNIISDGDLLILSDYLMDINKAL